MPIYERPEPTYKRNKVGRFPPRVPAKPQQFREQDSVALDIEPDEIYDIAQVAQEIEEMCGEKVNPLDISVNIGETEFDGDYTYLTNSYFEYKCINSVQIYTDEEFEQIMHRYQQCLHIFDTDLALWEQEL